MHTEQDIIIILVDFSGVAGGSELNVSLAHIATAPASKCLQRSCKTNVIHLGYKN